jgi:YfiH family protein
MIFFNHFKKHPGIIHGIFEKKEGYFDLTHLEKLRWVLKEIKKLNLPNPKLILAEQIHGKKIYFCQSNIESSIILGVDGLLSKTKNQILLIRTADCIPLLFYSPKEKIVGNLHVGRKGLAKGIIEEVAKFFKNPKEVLVGIGPHIRKCCYEFQERDYLEMKNWDKYFEKRNGKFYLDLTQILLDKLFALNFQKKNIEDLGFCTFCQKEKFFSARRGEKKLFLSFIGLR